MTTRHSLCLGINCVLMRTNFMDRKSCFSLSSSHFPLIIRLHLYALMACTPNGKPFHRKQLKVRGQSIIHSHQKSNRKDRIRLELLSNPIGEGKSCIHFSSTLIRRLQSSGKAFSTPSSTSTSFGRTLHLHRSGPKSPC